jgi:membrane protease subunit (stomatin/prohibitin family)
MAIIDRVKWDGTPDILAWKFPSEELATWSQLIVNETQEAFLVRGGVYEGPFPAGQYQLTTDNLPILRTLIGLPFGGQSPFAAEVWFVNKIANLDVRWGTPDAIQLQDPKFNVMVPVRAFGQYGFRIAEPKKFLLKLVGTVANFDSETLAAYFRGIFSTRIKVEISKVIVNQGVSVLELTPRLGEISELLKKALAPAVAEYGVKLEQFHVISINVPEEDPAVRVLKSALAKKAEMQILGFDYQQERSFNVLESAAKNEGTAGGLMGAGIGLGLGAGVGGPIGGAMSQIGSNLRATPSPTNESPKVEKMTSSERVRLLKELGELRSQGLLTDEELAVEKMKILNQ